MSRNELRFLKRGNMSHVFPREAKYHYVTNFPCLDSKITIRCTPLKWKTK